ncbi:hypothetical protein FJTKL_13268 [Diaporthe vaccinii]|uniref:Uncharacterized protein n=1 Tax=Diaporthe vaccinii TaxID=105482 RepID=A0ABR4EAV2_9PEZI
MFNHSFSRNTEEGDVGPKTQRNVRSGTLDKISKDACLWLKSNTSMFYQMPSILRCFHAKNHETLSGA